MAFRADHFSSLRLRLLLHAKRSFTGGKILTLSERQTFPHITRRSRSHLLLIYPADLSLAIVILSYGLHVAGAHDPDLSGLKYYAQRAIIFQPVGHPGEDFRT